MSTHLTAPAEHFCPVCGIHNRAQDYYLGRPTLMPMCPVCEDVERQAAEKPVQRVRELWRLIGADRLAFVGLLLELATWRHT